MTAPLRRGSPEWRLRISEGRRGKGLGTTSSEKRRAQREAWTPEKRAALSAVRRGTKQNGSAVVGYSDFGGYRWLTGQQDHPLSNRSGVVGEHRVALYSRIGDGSHPCHWIDKFDCGRDALEWGGRSGICADHLDHDGMNNDPENLVVSCRSCNTKRARLREKGLL